jgi:ribosomal protein S11
VDDLGKTHPISFQISIGNSSKVKKSSRNQKLHTSVRGFDLLKASVPKILGMGDFFFKDVTARTPSSISGSLNSSEENRVGSWWPV